MFNFKSFKTLKEQVTNLTKTQSTLAIAAIVVLFTVGFIAGCAPQKWGKTQPQTTVTTDNVSVTSTESDPNSSAVIHDADDSIEKSAVTPFVFTEMNGRTKYSIEFVRELHDVDGWNIGGKFSPNSQYLVAMKEGVPYTKSFAVANLEGKIVAEFDVPEVEAFGQNTIIHLDWLEDNSGLVMSGLKANGNYVVFDITTGEIREEESVDTGFLLRNKFNPEIGYWYSQNDDLTVLSYMNYAEREGFPGKEPIAKLQFTDADGVDYIFKSSRIPINKRTRASDIGALHTWEAGVRPNNDFTMLAVMDGQHHTYLYRIAHNK